ncbi:hypothetical protein DCC81_08145 [Chitinophaga parva]|uniref:Uncharacterized protein n=1 Tax=Chitinophaga parva TaxID=2169414 RepID=A0A2T7BP01_9BACT|nr:ankyrin repeat domain-containing protein [Chitinophaga parva]PUZ29407.1 hypothetical protein DCC81_08145 [Chitinophaga parva]
MKMIDAEDSRVILAIALIDAGDIANLMHLLRKYPELVQRRLINHQEGYFKDPYLLWFIADNPVRKGKRPGNMIRLIEELIETVKQLAPDTCLYQIDHALKLVASSHTMQVSGVLLPAMDLLIDAGASPDCAMEALTNGNLEAAGHLISRGAHLTLALAVCLERQLDIYKLGNQATNNEKLTALAAAAYYGKADKIKVLLDMNISPNGFPEAESGFHSHGTPLHYAVSSGDLPSVQLLVEAGAKLDVPDKVYNGTPKDWATYLKAQAPGEAADGNFAAIESYLLSKPRYRRLY